jgi:vacuolar-type H+-ATPase subunit E/Vma4
MTLNEKLDHFYTSVIDSATAQNVKIIEEYTNTLQKMSEERKNAALKKAENNLLVETDRIQKEKNRRLSNEAIELKRKVNEKTAEITDHIFDDVILKLKNFMQTASYDEYLYKKIMAANEFSQGHVIIIYINPTDQGLLSSLEKKTGVKLTISNRDFIGGIRAVIPSRSILIDDSFLTKLTEEKNSFKLL